MSKLGALTTLVKHFALARKNAHLHGDALRTYQDNRAHKIIQYAIDKSPFYRRHFAGLDIRNWRQFPLIDKSIMMSQFDDFTTRGVRRDEAVNLALAGETSRNYSPSLGDLTVGLSSGTSGHRGLFIVDPYERAAWAGDIMARVLPGLRWSGYKVLLFLRSGSNLYDSVGSRWLQFRFCDLMTPLDSAVAILDEFQPDILVAPPSLLAMFAVERKSSRLKTSPARVISIAEVLDPADERSIVEAFGSPVHQIYQCTEGLLATTCEQGNLHVLEDCVSLQYEPVNDDDDATRVSPIVTDLWRRTQPIIRYRLNDILILEHESCPCSSGFQRLARIEGRQDDVLYFANLAGDMRPFFPDVLRRIVLLSSDSIADFEIVQDHPGMLRVHFALTSDGLQATVETVEQSLRTNAESVLAQYGCKAGSIHIVEGLPPRRKDEKRRRVHRIG
jgi:putative adenylate-forming enzyme